MDIVISKKLTQFETRAGEGTRYLINKNLKNIVSDLKEEIQQFTNTNYQKQQAIIQLQNVIFVAEHNICEQFYNIFSCLLSIQISSEDDQLIKESLKCAEILGAFSKIDIIIPLVIKIGQEGEQQNNIKRVIGILKLLSELLKDQQSIKSQRYQLVEYINKIEQIHNENLQILQIMGQTIFMLLEVMMKENEIIKKEESEMIFGCLLTIQSHPGINEGVKEEVNMMIGRLGQISGFEDKDGLQQEQMNRIVERLIQGGTYNSWNRMSSERYKFEMIIRNSGIVVKNYIEEILLIIERVTHPNNDIEMRMDYICLIEHLLLLTPLHPFLPQYTFQIIIRILLQSARWKVGKSQIKIRKASIINIIHILDYSLISSQLMHKAYPELLPVIKTCLDDDWGPDLRMATLKLVEKMLVFINKEVDSEQLREIYPALLERLDDSQDIIRLEVTKSIIALFACQQVKMSPSMMDYILKTLFIHYDDQNQEMQMAVDRVLNFVSKIDPEMLLNQAKAVVDKMKYPRKCQELINLCVQLISQNQPQKYDEDIPD